MSRQILLGLVGLSAQWWRREPVAVLLLELVEVALVQLPGAVSWGQQAVRVRPHLSFRGGLSAGPFPANLGVTLAIGETEPAKIILDKRLPAGPWNVLVTLHSGLITNSSRAIITFPNNERSAPPYLVIGGLALLLLGLIALLVRLRGRMNRDRDRREPDSNPPTPESDKPQAVLA